MPSIEVRIEWDMPDDPNWLNPESLQELLGNHYPDIAFEVTDYWEYELATTEPFGVNWRNKKR